MFSSSTQLKFWTFSGVTELNRLRAEANETYVSEYGKNETIYYLTAEDETKVRRHYEYVIKDFCTRFQPPMPRSVLGTALVFFKRIYLHNSIMDYHPRDIQHTCVYLACKVEEFNVSLQQFVAQLKGDREAAMDVILSQELLLMRLLHFHLTVHNPFRPLEGLFIDLKTRCEDIDNVERLRPGAEEFLDKALHTDVPLIFSPSQIALAGILASGKNAGVSLDNYVANKLLVSGGQENLLKTVEHIKRIKYMVKNQDPLIREDVKILERRLDACRNPENNPNSETFKRKMEEYLDDEDEKKAKKRQKWEEVRLCFVHSSVYIQIFLSFSRRNQ
ncbi:hypothetical protein CAPTEDRAFT_171887 [Capitella teleta]|uniref:Cyclin-H n=1 Tax=Capitella teleta TaxID=283909 RepID=R7UPP9_CAPTE|nr:hypothetical protein CAPTEDRAFT_171887 [Capitella teleta]|eukprot:ELU05927.1 hypothetical protein CAPTEDRAFT_171887 [Capitella teleta]